MSSTQEHTVLVTATRIELGREPDFTLWPNSKVTYVDGQPRAKPGLCKGASDLIGVLAPNGRIVALEAKTGGATTTKEQKMFLELIRKRGGFAAVFHSVEEARAALERARRGQCQ